MITYRNILKQSDKAAIAEILKSSGFFYDTEIDIAVELADENLTKGEIKSEYIFNIAEDTKRPVGFTCYGKIPGTASSFDLYWIAVHQTQRGKGLGKILMEQAVQHIKQLGGTSVWIETSSRAIYEPTRIFYLKNGCQQVAELADFYGPQDNKVIFVKNLDR